MTPTEKDTSDVEMRDAVYAYGRAMARLGGSPEHHIDHWQAEADRSRADLFVLIASRLSVSPGADTSALREDAAPCEGCRSTEWSWRSCGNLGPVCSECLPSTGEARNG